MLDPIEGLGYIPFLRSHIESHILLVGELMGELNSGGAAITARQPFVRRPLIDQRFVVLEEERFAVVHGHRDTIRLA